MKDLIHIAAMAAALIGGAIYTQPGSKAHDAMHEHIDGNVKKAVRYVQQLPYIRLLKWENDYQPRPTLKRLEVVPATDTPYTAEELEEIYSEM